MSETKLSGETDGIPLGSWLVLATAQRYFYGGEETIVEMSSCHFIVMTLFFLQDCHVLWNFYICFCLTLDVSQHQVSIPGHASSIASALKAGIVLLFFVFNTALQRYKAVTHLVVFPFSVFKRC